MAVHTCATSLGWDPYGGVVQSHWTCFKGMPGDLVGVFRRFCLVWLHANAHYRSACTPLPRCEMRAAGLGRLHKMPVELKSAIFSKLMALIQQNETQRKDPGSAREREREREKDRVRQRKRQ